MKRLIIISILLFEVLEISAQCEKIFNYSDSIFELESIRYLDLKIEYNRGSLKLDSTTLKEIKSLSEFISSHPKMKFDIEYHTASRGSDAFLLNFSQSLAEDVTRILIYRDHIDSLQINPVGYGRLNPLIKDDYINQLNRHQNDVEVIEELHLLNRRFLLRIKEIKTE